MRNICLTLAYEGTDYSGWQKQPGLKTIQGTLEQALKKITGAETPVTGAGRTDAGVHARGQVANFHTSSPIPTERFPVVLNTVLPEDIIVLAAAEVEPGFHSQYQARAKTYVYRIDNGQYPDLFWRRFALHCRYRLDLDAMSAAAAYLVGRHDFRSFCASGTAVTNFVRTVSRCSVVRDGCLVSIYLTADGFLYNMVRIIAGTLLEAAKGRLAADAIPAILTAGRRELAGPTLPPHGLCLEEVQYRENAVVPGLDTDQALA